MTTEKNGNDKLNVEAAKTLADLAKEALRFGKTNESSIQADETSTSEYLHSLHEALAAVNEEIKTANSADERSQLYKQRENILNRMEKEKEQQRDFNNANNDKDRSFSKGLFTAVAAVAIGAGAIATAIFLDEGGPKKS